MVKIQRTELLSSSEIDVIRQQLDGALGGIRDELDDHRQSINEGTQEVAATNEWLNELSLRMDKLTERVDELTMLLKGTKEEKSFDFRPLSENEKEVFAALYALTETQPYSSYDQVARKAALSKDLVVTYVTSMIQKGVPLLKKHQGSRVFIRIDDAFRTKQAKDNVVGLSAPLTRWL